MLLANKIQKLETRALTSGVRGAGYTDTKEVLEIAAAAAVDKQGWRIVNDKVLLCQATKKYKKPVYHFPGWQIPFNETADALEAGGDDHWYEVGPLSTPKVEAQTGRCIQGRLFTTRMPRGLDMQPGDFKGEVDISKCTCKRRFIEKVRDNQIKCAIVLVEDEEFEKGKSKDLLAFYRSLGITVHHTPISDFSTPSFELEANNIATLDMNLSRGINCLVHCWGGSGRTGTVVIGALQNLGIKSPIKFGRNAKSVYLDISEQEDFVIKQRLVCNERMLKECPDLVHDIILAHINHLCGKLDDSEHKRDHIYVTASTPATETERSAILDLFNTMDNDGHDGTSINEIFQFTQAQKAMVESTSSDKVFANITPNNLHQLFGKFDPTILEISQDEESIPFELFLKVMHTNVTSAGAREANLKKDSGF
jgi:hypothetical protein